MFIVLVEDDPYIAQSICAALNYLNISVEHVSNARAADYFIRHSAVDLCLLDLGLPDQDGLDLLHSWRRDQIDLPVLVLTARLRTDQCVQALNAGADDYLTKPFSMVELIARIRAVLRRIRPGLADDRLNHGDIIIDRVSHRVKRSGQEVHLGPTEFRLLDHFMQHPGRVFSREQLLDAVWGSDVYVEARTVDVHVGRLRKALSIGDDSANPIRTVRSAGYSLDLEG